MGERAELARLAKKIQRAADDISKVVAGMPEAVREKCVKPSARLIAISVKLDGILSELGDNGG